MTILIDDNHVILIVITILLLLLLIIIITIPTITSIITPIVVRRSGCAGVFGVYL